MAAVEALAYLWRKVVTSPTFPSTRSQSRSTRRAAAIPWAPRSVTLYCAEPLRAAACVVADSLAARGWRVRLESGSSAKAALRRSLRTHSGGLRVVCVAEPLDRDVERKTMRALDREGRGDLIIVPLETPRTVVQAIEKHAGTFVPSRRASNRATRAYLARPTLVESQLDVGQWWRYGLAGVATAAAVFAIVAAGVSAESGARAARAETPRPQPTAIQRSAEPSRLVDDMVYAARAPVLDDEVVLLDEPVDDEAWPDAPREPILDEAPWPEALPAALVEPIDTGESATDPPAAAATPSTVPALGLSRAVDGRSSLGSLAPANVFPGGPLVPRPIAPPLRTADSTPPPKPR